MEGTPEQLLKKWQGKTIKAVAGKIDACILILVDDNRRITNLQEGREILAALCAKEVDGAITI